MPQRGLGTLSRQDILLAPGSQTSGATALFLYSGEVTCNFTSTSGSSLSDQLYILIEPNPNITDPLNQIIGWGSQSAPLPIVLPTSWNSNGNNTVIAINSPALQYISDASAPSGSPGLYIVATVTVQQGSLLNAQYQLSMRVKV